MEFYEKNKLSGPQIAVRLHFLKNLIGDTNKLI